MTIDEALTGTLIPLDSPSWKTQLHLERNSVMNHREN